MERLDLRLVEYFVAVADELHFGRAAARLHIAQPSLSQQIRKLETQVGVPLLVRTSRRVELTPAGATLQREGKRTLATAERALRAARAAAGERLTIGFYGSAASGLLTDVLNALNQRLPAVEVVLRELELSHVEDITDGRVDIAFTRLRPGEADLEVEVLATQARVVALPAAHPLASRDSVAFADLRDESFITGPQTHNPGWRAQWLAEQQRHGLPGRISAEAASVQEILTLVATGRGVCLVPAPAAALYPRAEVAYVTVRDAEPAIVSLAWSHDRLSPTGREFLAIARSAARQATDGTASPTAPAVPTFPQAR
jgi:DNA-binding transcriptional LysR family regulator